MAAASGKVTLATAAAHVHGVNTSTRPATQSAASAAKAGPVGVGQPLQFLPAVNRKPTITASTNPNSISWACHTGPFK